MTINLRKQIRFPICTYDGVFPSISNRLSDFSFPQFVRYGSQTQPAPFHCFVDDWRLESIWRSDSKFVEKALLVGSAVAPDFSVYSDFPYLHSMYQIWRSRLICAWWSSHGVFSIPVLQWTCSRDSQLPDYFQGLHDCDVIAVRCPSREPDVIEDYLICARRFLQIHQPKLVLHFGLQRGSDVWPNSLVLPLNPRLPC